MIAFSAEGDPNKSTIASRVTSHPDGSDPACKNGGNLHPLER